MYGKCSAIHKATTRCVMNPASAGNDFGRPYFVILERFVVQHQFAVCSAAEPSFYFFPLLQRNVFIVAVLCNRTYFCAARIIISAVPPLDFCGVHLKLGFAVPAFIRIRGPIHTKGFAVNSIIGKSIQSKSPSFLGGGDFSPPPLFSYLVTRMPPTTEPRFSVSIR